MYNDYRKQNDEIVHVRIFIPLERMPSIWGLGFIFWIKLKTFMSVSKTDLAVFL